MLLEGERVAFGASGRNGGFVDASLTHGIENGMARWPGEMDVLERLARENFDAIGEAIRAHGIDARFEQTGELAFATEPYMAEYIDEAVETARAHGWAAEALNAEQARAEVHSPTYHGAVYVPDGRGVVDPARLAWGLAGAARAAGARVYERSPVTELEREGAGVRARVRAGHSVRARHVVLATSAFPPLVRAIRRYVVPVYDYVLVSEPLGRERRESIGWERRQGLTDMGNQFHYYRLIGEDRILFGGYDAIYNFGNGMGPRLDDRPESFELLAEHFFATFPQLEGTALHAPLGRSDRHLLALLGDVREGARRPRRCSRSATPDSASARAASGREVALDLVQGLDTERTRLELVRSKPVPFPPEPLRWAGITMTRRALARADRREGRRGPWLRLLDRLGMGFDS